jgi:redox-sensing transcriptional repressor
VSLDPSGKPDESPPDPVDATRPHRGIPEATVARLPVYLRALTGLAERSVATVSSEELAALAGVGSAKLRKDLSHLGSYGTRGVGYDVDYLVYQISRELGLTQDWPVAIVGIGNLGQALAGYGGFRSRGFRVVALFDTDPQACGTSVAVCRSLRSATSTAPSSGTGSASASSPLRPTPPRTPATGWSPPECAASSTSRRSCSPVLRRRRRPQGRPVDGAADPGLPLAAQRQWAVGVGPGGEARMSLLVVGLSHRTTPVAVLERVTLTSATASKLARDVASATTSARRWCSRRATGRDLRRGRQVPRRRRRDDGAARRAQRRPGRRAEQPISTSTTRTVRSATCSR